MLGKFFAFAMLVLIILVIVQFSTLSDQDVEQIKAKIEEQQQNKNRPAATSPDTRAQSRTIEATISDNDPLLSEAPIAAYESFLDAAPDIKFESELHSYMTPSAINEFKRRFAGFSDQDPLESFKLLHTLQAMEYIGLQYKEDNSAVFSFIASSELFRRMAGVVAVDENVETLELFSVVMIEQAGNWIINEEYSTPVVNAGFGDLPDSEKFKPLLEQYYAKRQARTANK